MEVIVEGFKAGISLMTWYEAVAVFFGLLSVWYAKKENILVFPTGIVSVLIYVYICFGARLYADMGINAYYFVMSVYGWYVWSGHGYEKDKKPISTNSLKENGWGLAILLGSFLLLHYVLSEHTDSDVPFWDALTTAFAFTAMWLMAKKKIENWIAWIITDFISIPLYFYKGYILTSFQFLVFLIIAVAGYMAWRKTLKQQKHNA